MCGICVLWGTSLSKAESQKCIHALSARGPDYVHQEFLTYEGNITRSTASPSFTSLSHSTFTSLSLVSPVSSVPSHIELSVGFTRLHIQGEKGGVEQPFRDDEHKRLVLCNGEIFNSAFLIQNLGLVVPEGSSDCAVIPALLSRGMSLPEVCRQLDGDFAIVVVDLEQGCILAARDPYGVRPLFYAHGLSHRFDNAYEHVSESSWSALASEWKGIPDGITYACAIEPGTVQTFFLNGATSRTEMWHEVPWLKTPLWTTQRVCGAVLRNALEEAVAKRLATVREVGACLSGGLDSSLVASLAAQILSAQGKQLHTYSIGMEGSSDLAHARLVAQHIHSIHHERIVTAEECLACIPSVIQAIETFDITTVRASVGNYLVGQLIRNETPTVKVVLNGDGADEALGGYLYMQASPDDAAFETETDRLLREIHRYDVLRSERSMAAHGLESRSPFLDRQFVSVVRGIATELLRPSKKQIEKKVLREAFATAGVLPDAVLWRRKEAFSDGISRADKSWFEMAKEEGEKRAGGRWKEEAEVYAGTNPPLTAEAFWYRSLFHSFYPECIAEVVAPAMWMPRFLKGATDPSARTLQLYANT
jgi:asparagine synthase (glutamine-hydrolysing)